MNFDNSNYVVRVTGCCFKHLEFCQDFMFSLSKPQGLEYTSEEFRENPVAVEGIVTSSPAICMSLIGFHNSSIWMAA